MYAVARIYLDNFPHLKAYWPAVGRMLAQVSLSFGVDDLDGTINDSTKIYSLAGAEDQNPVMTVTEMVTLIREAKRTPVERDSLYNPLSNF
jgi:aminodeoxyfutalosine synthase